MAAEAVVAVETVAKEVAKEGRRRTLVGGKDILCWRLFKSGNSEQNVGKELNEWMRETKRFKKWDVGEAVKELRKRQKYNHACKLMEWATKRRMNLTVSDHAIHLDLISKAKGISAAEEYFKNLPDPAKNHLPYGALLNAYCKELDIEKAEALMEKMKETNFAERSPAYNSLATLYMKTGRANKVPEVIQDMKARNVMLDVFSYNIWMRSIAASGDIRGVERVIEEMKRDGRVESDWTTYSNLASIYLEAGLLEEARNAVKEIESKAGTTSFSAYQFLITLYGNLGSVVDVYRIWRSMKLAFEKVGTVSYLNMILVLIKLNDLPGAEKCFLEWESSSHYDMRVGNAMIGGYLEADEVVKAQEVLRRAVQRGASPTHKTWESFAAYHLKKEQVNIAIESIEKGISALGEKGHQWKPTSKMISAVMSDLERRGDVNAAENFFGTLKKAECVDAAFYEALIRTYYTAGKTSPPMRRRLKMENLEVSPDTEKLLDTVCKE